MDTATVTKEGPKTAMEIPWERILEDAVNKPGSLMEAYRAFHSYSLRNAMLVFFECHGRGIEPGPVTTYRKWKEKGRQVRKGEKALTMMMPLTYKAQASKGQEQADDADAGESSVRTRFVFRRHWFAISQTDGPETTEFEQVPGWDREKALKALSVEEIPFDRADGNTQGFARGGKIAINPMAQSPIKTTFHELGHVLLHQGDHADQQDLPRSLKEAEAEGVALICTEALGLEGADYCRGYIQNWLAGAGIPRASASRIFTAADKIIKAGQR